MRVPARDRGNGLVFNITPLIDIVFLLIIFFLVASHIVKSESQAEVTLPEAVAIDDEEQLPNRIVITIQPGPNYLVGDRPTQFSVIEERLIAAGTEEDKPLEVRIRTDRSIPYRDIEPILTTAAQAGVTRIRFAVLQQAAP